MKRRRKVVFVLKYIRSLYLHYHLMTPQKYDYFYLSKGRDGVKQGQKHFERLKANVSYEGTTKMKKGKKWIIISAMDYGRCYCVVTTCC